MTTAVLNAHNGFALPESWKEAISRFNADSRKAADKLKDLMFALGLNVATRNARLNEITADIDAGVGAGLLRIYDGARPATGGAATTLLAELTFSDPSFPAASAGAMTANAITQDSSANATGTATWFRVVDSAANQVIDGDVGTSGSDLNLNSTAISAGATVSVTSFQLTEGNP